MEDKRNFLFSLTVGLSIVAVVAFTAYKAGSWFGEENFEEDYKEQKEVKNTPD